MPTWFERLLQDVRHGARLLAKSPGFTAIAVLSIAFGTGANVAIFSVADALLLRPLQVPRPGELLIIGSPVTRDIQTVTATSYLDYLDIRHDADSFAVRRHARARCRCVWRSAPAADASSVSW